MSYLLDNPFSLILLLLGIGITIVAGTKFFEEYGLNKKLRLKQKSMRINITGGTRRTSLLGALALAPTVVVLLAVMLTSTVENPRDGQFISVYSSDDVVQIFERFNTARNNSWFKSVDNVVLEETMDGAPEADAGGDEQGGTGSDDYSETNNQVLGVDEMDNVVTDGKYIYTMNGGQIQITLAYTNENGIEGFGVVTTIDYPSDYTVCGGSTVHPIGLYVDDDQFIVIASEYENYYYECEEDGKEPYYDYWYYGGQSNTVKVFVYEKEDFTLEQEYSLNGYFTGTRKIETEDGEDSLYVITNKYIPFYQEDINVDDYLPYYEVNNQKVYAQYEDIIYVDGTSPNAFTTFYGIDLNKEKVDMETVLGDSGYNLYVSEDNMYLVGSVYYFWPLEADVAVSEPINEHRTAIMKVAIDDANVEFKALGYVQGYTLNQFSMDEHDGYLRITTTEGWWGDDINNRLWVLDENLDVVSVLENLGKPRETIRSTRFVGEYAYVVTFEQTDPFYVINISDPENPVKEGELEIPGFSTYLQPLSNDYMLGIGFDADNDGRTTGIKIQIYDISDKANPTVFDTIVFPYSDFDDLGWSWSWSSVTYNHKDLLLSLNKGIIAFPFSSSFYTEEGGYQYNSGILVYNLDLETGFSDEYSFIQHETNSEDYVYVYKAKFISDYIYAISNKYISVSTLENPESILDQDDIFNEETYRYYYGEEMVD